MAKTDKQKLDKDFHFRYSEAQETELFALAKKSDRTPTDYIRKLISYASKNKLKF